MPMSSQDVFVDNTVLIEGGNTNAVKTDGSGVTQPVSGSVSVSGSVTTNQGTPTSAANSWPVEVTDGTNTLGTSAHPLQTISAVASTSTVTAVTTTGSNITLLAANPNRKKAILFIEGSTQYIKLGAVASATSYTYKATANNTVIEITNWAGIIDSIGTSGKAVLVTELS